MSDPIEVGPTHPLWTSWDDDDWNGATAANWMHASAKLGATIKLMPPKNAKPELVERIRLAMTNAGAAVSISEPPNILGLCGFAGSGKDTTADFLIQHHGFIRIALADPLKRICRDVFGFTDDQLWGPSASRNAPDLRYLRSDPTLDAELQFLTPRFALQTLGTEWGRACYPDVWIDYALRAARQVLEEDFRYDPKCGAWGIDGRTKGVVISDVRFLNEVQAIRSAGGRVWLITRTGAGLEGTAAQHRSEQEMNEIPRGLFECSILNEGTLEDLRSAVDYFVSATKGEMK